jgi:hypothetical protein
MSYIHTFLLCPLRTATTCSRSLLKTVAFLSAPPVTIFAVSLAYTSSARMPEQKDIVRRVADPHSFHTDPAF